MKDSCRCSACRAACRKFPGWFLPDEARDAIAAGFAMRLMADWYEIDGGRVHILCPAAIGYEGRPARTISSLEDCLNAMAGIWVKGRCTFLSANELCGLHSSGFKPHQCVTTFRCLKIGAENKTIMDHWNTDESRQLIDDWSAIVGIDLSK